MAWEWKFAKFWEEMRDYYQMYKYHKKFTNVDKMIEELKEEGINVTVRYHLPYDKVGPFKLKKEDTIQIRINGSQTVYIVRGNAKDIISSIYSTVQFYKKTNKVFYPLHHRGDFFKSLSFFLRHGRYATTKDLIFEEIDNRIKDGDVFDISMSRAMLFNQYVIEENRENMTYQSVFSYMRKRRIDELTQIIGKDIKIIEKEPGKNIVIVKGRKFELEGKYKDTLAAFATGIYMKERFGKFIIYPPGAFPFTSEGRKNLLTTFSALGVGMFSIFTIMGSLAVIPVVQSVTGIAEATGVTMIGSMATYITLSHQKYYMKEKLSNMEKFKEIEEEINKLLDEKEEPVR